MRLRATAAPHCARACRFPRTTSTRRCQIPLHMLARRHRLPRTWRLVDNTLHQQKFEQIRRLDQQLLRCTPPGRLHPTATASLEADEHRPIPHTGLVYRPPARRGVERRSVQRCMLSSGVKHGETNLFERLHDSRMELRRTHPGWEECAPTHCPSCGAHLGRRAVVVGSAQCVCGRTHHTHRTHHCRSCQVAICTPPTLNDVSCVPRTAHHRL